MGNVIKGIVSQYKGCASLFLKHLKLTTNHDKCGRHAHASVDSVADHILHTMPTAIDRLSPTHLMVVGKPRNEG